VAFERAPGFPGGLVLALPPGGEGVARAAGHALLGDRHAVQGGVEDPVAGRSSRCRVCSPLLASRGAVLP
jgi:hypothetical protein